MYKLFLLLILAFCSGSARAQGFGTIVGTVTDSSGAVIPNAQVKVINDGTQLAREVKSNAQGYYVIPSLDPAVYTLTVRAPGFSSFQKSGITLLADQSLTVSAPMTVGSEGQVITVETNPVEVDTSTSVLSQVVEP